MHYTYDGNIFLFMSGDHKERIEKKKLEKVDPTDPNPAY